MNNHRVNNGPERAICSDFGGFDVTGIEHSICDFKTRTKSTGAHATKMSFFGKYSDASLFEPITCGRNSELPTTCAKWAIWHANALRMRAVCAWFALPASESRE